MLLQLKRLDNATAERILEKIERAVERPTHFFERLVGREEYKLGAGDYRIIAKIFHNEKNNFDSFAWA